MPPSPEPTHIDELRELLDKLKLVLDESINGQEPLTTADLTPKLRDAWPELQAAFREVDQALVSLAETNDQEQKLKKAGLTGASWKLKWYGFKRGFSRLWQAGREGLRKATGWLLRWSNTILGSLTTVVPQAEIIKEFKECVENDIAEQGDSLPPRSI